MRDFFQILRDLGVYDISNHRMAPPEYMLNGNLVQFLSLDQESKKRGMGHWICYVNEVTEIDWV